MPASTESEDFIRQSSCFTVFDNRSIAILPTDRHGRAHLLNARADARAEAVCADRSTTSARSLLIGAQSSWRDESCRLASVELDAGEPAGSARTTQCHEHTLLQALRATFDDLDGRRDVRVVVIKGAGPAFCAGMDLKEMQQRRPGRSGRQRGRGAAAGERSKPSHDRRAPRGSIAGGCELGAAL